jgi:hypothetical protein
MSGLPAQERADAASVGFLREVPSQSLTRPRPFLLSLQRVGASDHDPILHVQAAQQDTDATVYQARGDDVAAA